MQGMWEQAVALLGPAVEAARRALAELEDDAIPAALQRVARSSDRRLPPPLARRLLDHLDHDDWLRERAVEAWPQADPDDPQPARAASALFLLRPPGWEPRLAAVVAGQEASSAQAEATSTRRRVEELERTVAELERKLAAVRGEAATREQELRERQTAELQRVKEAVARERRRADEAERAAQLAARQLERLREELAEADDRIAELRERLLKTRRAEPAAGTSEGWALGRDRPREVARLLDQILAAMQRPVQPSPPGRAGERPRMRLAEGVRPDSAAAVEWLLRREGPTRLLVDGYNLLHALDAADDPGARQRLVGSLARLRRLATGPLAVTCFFDTALSGEDLAVAGVTVRFVGDADRALAETAEKGGGEVVVVTSDREVRERCQQQGAVGLWSEAMAEWMRERGWFPRG